MMASAAANAVAGLAQFTFRPIIGCHDMRQLMKTCLFAFTDIQSVVRADLHPQLVSVSMTASPAADNGYRVGVCRESSPVRFHLLDDVNVSCAMPVIYYPIILHEHSAAELADRQACRELRVIRGLLQPSRLYSSLLITSPRSY